MKRLIGVLTSSKGVNIVTRPEFYRLVLSMSMPEVMALFLYVFEGNKKDMVEAICAIKCDSEINKALSKLGREERVC